LNFAWADEDIQLVEVVDKLLLSEWSLDTLRQSDDANKATRAIWMQLHELGVTTLLVPEVDRGSGGTLPQARLVAGVLGRHLAAPTFAWGAVLPALVAAAAAPTSARALLLEAMVDGGALVVPAFAGGGGALANLPTWSSDAEDHSEVESITVPFGAQATYGLVVDRIAIRGEIASVPIFGLDTSSLPHSPARSDLQSVAKVDVTATTQITALELPAIRLRHAVACLKLALAAYATGGHDRVCDIAAEYARTREQFGKPIGSFQAVAHRCVDMRARVDGDIALCDALAWHLAHGNPSAVRRSALAKARATRNFVEGSTGALHVFAGHGFSLESDVQLFYRVARGFEATWGTPDAEFAGNPRTSEHVDDDFEWEAATGPEEMNA
jgi:alkylation response protein AidB-like acyl-CoA dehydrogenase